MEAIDKKTIDELTDLMGDNVAGVFTAFIKSSDSNLEELEKAITDADIHGIERTAHTMKGSGANIGAKKFSALCSDAVEKARNKDNSGYEQILDSIQAEYAKVVKEIEQILKIG